MDQYILLAKSAIEIYIKEGKIISPPEDLPGEFLTRMAGTFVTIMKGGELRGCIGTYLPTKINIAQEIIHNAVAAATEDYRFDPIQKTELPYLSYTVYILSYPELVMEVDPAKWDSPKIRKILFDRVNPKKFGIIVKTTPFVYPNEDVEWFDGRVPFKSGLLLPDLEGIDTIEQQISIACQKGGINPEKEKIIIYRFTVKKYQQDAQ
ncbi:MAG: AMMECR1 domain-containing protein [bacterium]|nr:AMMECR1 domain-containing protein [bacterium]